MGRYNFMLLLAVFIILALAGTGSAATVTYNWSFTPPIVNNGSWTFSNTICGTDCTVKAGSNSTDGVPLGSLFASLTAGAFLASYGLGWLS